MDNFISVVLYGFAIYYFLNSVYLVVKHSDYQKATYYVVMAILYIVIANL